MGNVGKASSTHYKDMSFEEFNRNEIKLQYMRNQKSKQAFKSMEFDDFEGVVMDTVLKMINCKRWDLSTHKSVSRWCAFARGMMQLVLNDYKKKGAKQKKFQQEYEVKYSNEVLDNQIFPVLERNEEFEKFKTYVCDTVERLQKEERYKDLKMEFDIFSGLLDGYSHRDLEKRFEVSLTKTHKAKMKVLSILRQNINSEEFPYGLNI